MDDKRVNQNMSVNFFKRFMNEYDPEYLGL